MAVTAWTWFVALAGLLVMGMRGGLQFIAVLRPRSDWVIDTVDGGRPDATDPKAYFPLNRCLAWADSVF